MPVDLYGEALEPFLYYICTPYKRSSKIETATTTGPTEIYWSSLDMCQLLNKLHVNHSFF